MSRTVIKKMRGMEMVCLQIEKEHAQGRNVSLDMLRVLCMFLIILGHAIVHGQVIESLTPWSINFYLVHAMRAFLSVHVDCFVMLSGYFLCTHVFRLKKVFSLWIQAFFWSVLLYLLLCAVGIVPFQWISLGKACLPFTQRRYWFVTTYLLMYLLMPLLNAAIRVMSQRQYATFLMAFFVAYIALQNVFFWNDFTSVDETAPLLFVFLYLLAAYFRLYPPQRTRKEYFLCYAVLCLFAAAWKMVIPELTVRVFGRVVGENIFLTNNSVIVILAAACLFRFFEGLRISNRHVRKGVELLAPLTFGIYLIHEQPEVRGLLWRGWIRPGRFAQRPLLAVVLLGVAAAVFLSCALLECLRQKAFEVLSIERLAGTLADKVKPCGAWLIRKTFRLKEDDEGR